MANETRNARILSTLRDIEREQSIKILLVAADPRPRSTEIKLWFVRRPDDYKDPARGLDADLIGALKEEKIHATVHDFMTLCRDQKGLMYPWAKNAWTALHCSEVASGCLDALTANQVGRQHLINRLAYTLNITQSAIGNHDSANNRHYLSQLVHYGVQFDHLVQTGKLPPAFSTDIPDRPFLNYRCSPSEIDAALRGDRPDHFFAQLPSRNEFYTWLSATVSAATGQTMNFDLDNPKSAKAFIRAVGPEIRALFEWSTICPSLTQAMAAKISLPLPRSEFRL